MTVIFQKSLKERRVAMERLEVIKTIKTLGDIRSAAQLMFPALAMRLVLMVTMKEA